MKHAKKILKALADTARPNKKKTGQVYQKQGQEPAFPINFFPSSNWNRNPSSQVGQCRFESVWEDQHQASEMIKFYAVIEKRIIGLGRIVHTASESYEDWTVQETNLGLYKNKESAEDAVQKFKISYAKSSSRNEREFVVQEIQIKD